VNRFKDRFVNILDERFGLLAESLVDGSTQRGIDM